MDESEYDFLWPAPLDDPPCRWVPGKMKMPTLREGRARQLQEDEDQLWLVRPRVPAKIRQLFYRPLEMPGLFMEFADLYDDLNPDTVLGFIERRGCLGVYWDAKLKTVEWGDSGLDLVPVANPYDPTPRKPERMEFFGRWCDEVVRMHFLTDLWGYARDGDQQSLAEFVRWDGDKIVFRRPPYRPTWLWELEKPEVVMDFKEQVDPSGKPSFKRGDVLTPAKIFVTEQLGDALRTCVQERFRWSYRKGAPEFYMRPNSLVSAMYLQFALAVANPGGGFRFGRCHYCRKRIALGPVGSRSDRLTCSDTCRTLLSRRRRRARELHKEGRPIKAIAKEVGSDAKTVKGWINTTGE